MADIIGSQAKRTHEIYVKERTVTSVTGVEEVCSFDENSVVLNTVSGIVTIAGEGLSVTSLNLDIGEVSVSGRIDGFFYTDRREERGGIMKRIFG